jgi:hypothetical protein
MLQILYTPRLVASRSFLNYSGLRDARYPPRCRRRLCCAGLLRSVCWYVLTDVSGQSVDPVFKDQAVLGWPASRAKTSLRNYQPFDVKPVQFIKCIKLRSLMTRCSTRSNFVVSTDYNRHLYLLLRLMLQCGGIMLVSATP